MKRVLLWKLQLLVAVGWLLMAAAYLTSAVLLVESPGVADQA